MSTYKTSKRAKELKRAFEEGDLTNPLVMVVYDEAWRIFKDTGCNCVARDAALEAGFEAALVSNDEHTVWCATRDAGYYEALNADKLGARAGKRLQFTAKVKGFGKRERGRYIDPLIYLEIHEGGERLGCDFLPRGKAWKGVKVGDQVTFNARVDGYKLTHPTKVEVLEVTLRTPALKVAKAEIEPSRAV